MHAVWSPAWSNWRACFRESSAAIGEDEASDVPVCADCESVGSPWFYFATSSDEAAVPSVASFMAAVGGCRLPVSWTVPVPVGPIPASVLESCFCKDSISVPQGLAPATPAATTNPANALVTNNALYMSMLHYRLPSRAIPKRVRHA